MADAGDSMIAAFRKAATYADQQSVALTLRLDGVWLIGKGRHPQRGNMQCCVIVDWDQLAYSRVPFEHLRQAINECAGKIKLAEEAA